MHDRRVLFVDLPISRRLYVTAPSNRAHLFFDFEL
jgi:hypothetical protein